MTSQIHQATAHTYPRVACTRNIDFGVKEEEEEEKKDTGERGETRAYLNTESGGETR